MTLVYRVFDEDEVTQFIRPADGGVVIDTALAHEPIWRGLVPAQRVVLVSILLMGRYRFPFDDRDPLASVSYDEIARWSGRGVTRYVVRRAIEHFVRAGLLEVRRLSARRLAIRVRGWPTSPARFAADEPAVGEKR